MKSNENKILEELNERVITQSVIIQTLVDILIENNIIIEEELDLRLTENTVKLNQYLDNLHKNDESVTFDINNWYGPIGEA